MNEKSRIGTVYPEFDWDPKTSRIVNGLVLLCVILFIVGGLVLLIGIMGSSQDPTAVMVIMAGISIMISGIFTLSLARIIETISYIDKHLQ